MRTHEMCIASFTRDHLAYTQRGVRFVEAPRHEPYGIVAVFEDPYGNRWDLIENVSLAINDSRQSIDSENPAPPADRSFSRKRERNRQLSV
jgi:hypothetical protein